MSDESRIFCVLQSFDSHDAPNLQSHRCQNNGLTSILYSEYGRSRHHLLSYFIAHLAGPPPCIHIRFMCSRSIVAALVEMILIFANHCSTSLNFCIIMVNTIKNQWKSDVGSTSKQRIVFDSTSFRHDGY